MNEHERALIAALAEGSLEDETEARALLERSDDARAEYRLQRAALEALSEAGPATMTESERVELHRDLWNLLRAEKAKSRSTSGIYGWSLVAAALLVVVGLTAVLGGGFLNQAQSGDDAAMEALAEPAADLAEDTDTTAAAAAAPAEEADTALSPTAQGYFAEEAERLRTGESTFLSAETGDENLDCLGRAGLGDHEVAALLNEDGSAPVEGRYLAAVPADEAIGPETPIHFVDADRCELVYTDG